MAEPIADPIRPSRLSDGRAEIPSPPIQKPESKPIQSPDATAIRRRVPMSMPDMEMSSSKLRSSTLPVSPDAKIERRQAKIAEPVEPISSRPKMSGFGSLPTVDIGQSKLASATTMPQPEGVGGIGDRMSLTSEVRPIRVRDRIPLPYGADPTQTVAAVRAQKADTDRAVEERRKPLGIRGSMTHSQLMGNGG